MEQDPQASSGMEEPTDGEADDHAASGTAMLALGAVGVVYGDIGTSPIYALREAMRAATGDGPNSHADILGILSLIVWSLILIVTVKYALIVLRADNRGEGGTLSLMALARPASGRFAPAVLVLGMLGAALFYGDAIISPAISVLSAVEGLQVVSPGLADWVVPITVAILVTLFSVQRFGTAKVASIFGPVTAVWFLVLGATGAWHIVQNPVVLSAFNPAYAAVFFTHHHSVALIVVAAAFLAITGAEALYVDLGHFGRKPILIAWFCLVFPALLLNYFGQGAFVLSRDGVAPQPLFQMMPDWAGLPFVTLAMMATVIASQAAITGAYSLTRQAIQLGILPRLVVRHTSAEQSGQIYMPQVNMLLLIGVIILVLEFGSSGALAFAYGVSLSAAMAVTAVLLFFVMWKVWKRPAWLAGAVVLPFLAIELGFAAANTLKIPDGGWVSLAVAAVLMTVMLTWRRGSGILFRKTRKAEVPLAELADMLAKKPPTLVDGTAVFLTGDRESAPTALLHSLKHYRVLHKQNVILTLVTAEQPRVPAAEKAQIEVLNPLFLRVTLTFGFMEQPNVPKGLALCRKQGWKFDIMTTSFFLSRRTLKASATSGMPVWQDKLYIMLARNASEATAYFQIPTGRVVEIGTQVVI